MIFKSLKQESRHVLKVSNVPWTATFSPSYNFLTFPGFRNLFYQISKNKNYTLFLQKKDTKRKTDFVIFMLTHKICLRKRGTATKISKKVTKQ